MHTRASCARLPRIPRQVFILRRTLSCKSDSERAYVGCVCSVISAVPLITFGAAAHAVFQQFHDTTPGCPDLSAPAHRWLHQKVIIKVGMSLNVLGLIEVCRANKAANEHVMSSRPHIGIIAFCRDN